jgi:hypothetical protein
MEPIMKAEERPHKATPRVEREGEMVKIAPFEGHELIAFVEYQQGFRLPAPAPHDGYWRIPEADADRLTQMLTSTGTNTLPPVIDTDRATITELQALLGLPT